MGFLIYEESGCNITNFNQLILLKKCKGIMWPIEIKIVPIPESE